MRRAATASLLGLLGAALATGCNASGASAPSQPAFDTDVLPIFQAHCTRCHGAGGTLNVAHEPTGPDAGVLASINQNLTLNTFQTQRVYLDIFPDTEGDCSSTDAGSLPVSCKHGAHYFVRSFDNSIGPTAKPPLLMPPAPAPRLDDWEYQVVENWIKTDLFELADPRHKHLPGQPVAGPRGSELAGAFVGGLAMALAATFPVTAAVVRAAGLDGVDAGGGRPFQRR